MRTVGRWWAHGATAWVLALAGCQLLDLEDIPDPNYKPPPPKVEGPRIDATPVMEKPAFVERHGLDAFGYPSSLPDRVALLNLVYLKRFDALAQWMTYFQDEFERDYRKEEWPDRALSAFFVGDPKVTAILDEWVARSPNHFAPWLARGNHRVKMASYYRGGKWAYQTSAAQFASMDEYHAAATKDLRRALELRPKLVAAYVRLLLCAQTDADGESRKILDEATAVCPLCYAPRSAYLDYITPRWGGSYAKMQKYIDELAPQIQQNPRLAALRGMIALDRCDLRVREDREQARSDCDEAIAAGPEAAFMATASRVYDPETEAQSALKLLDAALAFDPQERSALERRYKLRANVKDYLGAAEDLIVVRHLDPTEDHAEAIRWLVDMLRYQGDQLYKAGKGTEALPYFRLGLQLSPDDQDLRRRSGWTQRGGTETAVANELQQQPDDFELRLERDHALARQGKFGEVVTMWDEFIGRHATDPRPYSERAGAKWHLGKRDDARADMKKACELGLQKACQDAVKMAAIR